MICSYTECTIEILFFSFGLDNAIENDLQLCVWVHVIVKKLQDYIRLVMITVVRLLPPTATKQ